MLETDMLVLLRREAVKLRKETGEKRWYAPIEELDRSHPQVNSICCTVDDGVNLSCSDHHAVMLWSVYVAHARTNVPLPLYILCLHLRCFTHSSRSVQYRLYQEPQLQPGAGWLELPRDLDRNADWH